MITVKSTAYWAAGMTVRWRENVGSRDGRSFSGWGAQVDFYDDGLVNDNPDAGTVSTQGTLNTRYFVSDSDRVSGLSLAIDTLITDAQRLGIKLDNPVLYYEGDGENEEWPPPVGWRVLLSAEAARIGWRTPYGGGRDMQ